MKLSEMKQILGEEGIQLTRSLGQSFLHDGNQLRRIVETAELKKTDRVLEIGPGLGPLTELLIERAGEVLAIEKDARLVRVLERRFASWLASPRPRLRLFHDDALEYLRREPRDWSDWKLVANLPYSVASPIVVELAQGAGSPQQMVATLQLEVVRRLVAKPGTEHYGLLTLLLQLRYEPQGWFKIPSSCFFPEPDVDSACVELRRRTAALLEPAAEPVFQRIVKRSFSQRRKMMFKLLKADWPEGDLERALLQAQVPKQTRAENVSLEQFVRLTQALSPEAPTSEEIFDVVDERDEVVGRDTRARVHRLGLRHRAVHILVFNRRGEVFLQKRSLKKDRQPGKWDSSASGHVDAGEDYDHCALRELREEIGLEPAAAPRRLFKFAASKETDQEHVWVYRCEAEGPFALNAEEIAAGGWFPPESVDRWSREKPEDFAAAFLAIWHRLRHQSKGH